MDAESADPEPEFDPLAVLDRLAHELKNAVWALSGYTELALGKVSDRRLERLSKDLSTLTRSGRRLAALAREMDQVRRLAEGQGDEPRPCALPLLYGEVRGWLVREYEDAADRLPEHAPRYELGGDPGFLTLVLEHLLANALAYAGGAVTLAVEPDGQQTRLVLADQGREEDPALSRERWLVPGETSAGRLGLGLPTCRALTESMGGSLALAPADPRGTVVTIRLPGPARALDRDEAAALPPAPAGPAVARDSSVSVSLDLPRPPTPTVLYIDDRAMNRALVQRILESRGWTLHLAEDGRRGLDLASREPADLYLLDIHMPGLSGVEVAQELRSRGVTAPLVGFTASEPRDLEHNEEYRIFDAFLEKGLGAAELPEKILALLEAHGSAPAPPPVAPARIAEAEELLAGLRALGEDAPAARRGRAEALLERARELRERLEDES